MAILPISDQYKYSKRGPLDAKALVKTYAELLNPNTWTVDGTLAAYNGLITAVWLNKDDTSKNGIYFLQDPAVTGALKAPDVTNEANWHKLGSIENLTELAEQIATIKTDLSELESTVDTIDAVIAVINANLAKKADADKVYTIDQVDAKFVTSAQVDAMIAAIVQPKGSTEISVAEDGILAVKELNVSKLVQTVGDMLILCGGCATTTVVE